jgi:hypothetical protein
MHLTALLSTVSYIMTKHNKQTAYTICEIILEPQPMKLKILQVWQVFTSIGESPQDPFFHVCFTQWILMSLHFIYKMLVDASQNSGMLTKVLLLLSSSSVLSCLLTLCWTSDLNRSMPVI